MLEGIDADGNGEIDMSEFVVAGLPLNQIQRRDKVTWRMKTKQAFDSLDKDKDGFIDVSEIRDELLNDSLSSSLHSSGSLDKQLEEELKEVDIDGNGKIDYAEFCQLLRSRSSGNKICR